MGVRVLRRLNVEVQAARQRDARRAVLSGRTAVSTLAGAGLYLPDVNGPARHETPRKSGRGHHDSHAVKVKTLPNGDVW